MKKRPSWRFYPLFVLVVAIILTAVMFIASVLLFWLSSAGILEIPRTPGAGERSFAQPFLLIMTASVVIGLMLTVVFGRKTAKPVDELSDGMKAVASGNFNVELEEGPRPFNEINRNFNRMVKDLASIEMLRSDFTANVSHEFKSPLSSIQGYATLLQDPTLSEEERQEYVQVILDATRSLSNMSSNILELSSLETQDAPLSREVFSLDEQLRQAIVMLEPVWASKELRFQVNLERFDIRGNEEMLKTVWMNLLSNAIKFSPQGESIRVRLIRTSSFALVSIADAGCGISDVDQQRVFDKFYQTDASRETEGNGLGLALAAKIVEKHGGVIQVKSEIGKGSEFTVSLPL